MIDFSRTMNLSFWFSWLLSIVMIFFISDFSERSKRFSFAIDFRKESHHFFHFLSTFSSSTIDFSTFSLFFSNHRKRSKTEWRSSQFWLFFSRKQRLSNTFFFELREISVDANQFERQKRNLKRCFVSMKREKKKTTKDEKICRLLKSTKEKSKRFSASDITRFENSIAATELSKTGEKVSKIKTVLTIFSIDLVIDLIVFFFDWMIFFCLKLILSIAATARSKSEQFVILRSNTEQSAHRLSSRTKKLNIHSIFFWDSTNKKVSSFWLLKLYVLRIVFKWVALCALDCRYLNQI